MTGPVPPLPQAGDSEPPPPGGDRVSLGKALVLLVVGVVVGVVLLQWGSHGPAGVSAPVATASTTTSAPTTTTTTAPVDKSSVKVLAANATATSGAAQYYTQKLQALGWETVAPIDATTKVPTSTVYYASGQQAAAQSIATSFGLKPSAVQALTTSVPVQGTTGVDVVLVVGADLGAQVSTSTSST